MYFKVKFYTIAITNDDKELSLNADLEHPKVTVLSRFTSRVDFAVYAEIRSAATSQAVQFSNNLNQIQAHNWHDVSKYFIQLKL